MLNRIITYIRQEMQKSELKALGEFSLPGDSPGLALKIAQQRRLGTRIGRCCRFMGRVDPLNPHLIEIGDYCVIGAETMLLAHGPGFNGSDRLVVRDYVYLGFRVTVLPGVTIGAGSIVGAGSVVTRDVPAGTVLAGNPARVLRDVTSQEAEDIRHRMHNDLLFGKEVGAA